MLGKPMAKLSPELLEEIIDWVEYLGNRKDLWSLLRTDRVFGDRCRTTLFRAVPVGPPAMLQMLRDLFDASPFIPCYVREVASPSLFGQIPGPSTTPTSSRLWAPLPPALNPPPPPPPPPPQAMFNRSEFDTELGTWLVQSFFSSSLVELSVSHTYRFPLEILRAFPNLKSLTLSSVQLHYKEVTASPDRALEVLSCGDSEYAMQKIINATDRPYVSMRRLKKLQLCPRDKPAMSNAQAILDQASTLEEVDLTAALATWPSPVYHYTPLSGFLNFGKLGKLRRFQLGATISAPDAEDASVVHDIASVLSTVPSCTGGFERVSLYIEVDGAAPWDSTRNQDWNSVMIFELEMNVYGLALDSGALHSYVDDILRPAFVDLEGVDYRWYPK
ncbi:hypothetical protein BKA70DRAFT_1281078, partial [Coprinopsis sp. MPI-PUGE-AT-0042]